MGAKADRTFPTTSVKMIVPTNTSIVPIQCCTVNGLLKYTIENSSDTNLRSVTTSVTVSEEHSVVSTYTELMHTYCVSTLPSRYSQVMGRDTPRAGIACSGLALASCTCSQMLPASSAKKGSGSRPIRADTNSASVSSAMPSVHQKNTDIGSSSAAFFSTWVLSTFVPDTIVHITMPSVIMPTDRYLEKSYRFFRISMPITMFAISDPARKIMCSGMGMLKSNA
uniref:Uncharacterized protein n=1 Tax=Anopheles coluzzii TaxID=1518534 RepID=A0A8W7Q278_ANOCL